MSRSLIHMFYIFLIFTSVQAITVSANHNKMVQKCAVNPENLKKIASDFISVFKDNKKTFEEKFGLFFNEHCNGDSIDLKFSLAYAYFLNKNCVMAIRYSLQARTAAQIQKKKELEAEILLLTGNAYHLLNYFEKAMYYYNQALMFDKNELSQKRKNRTMLDIGNAYLSRNNLDSALLYYQMAMENSKKNNDSINVIASLINIGNLYRSAKDYIKAKEITRQALDLCLDYKSDLKIICYFNLAQLNYNKKQYLESREYFEQVLLLINQSRFESLIPEIYKYKALMDYETGDFEFAIRNCRLFQASKDKYFTNETFLKSLHEISRILLKLIDRPYADVLLARNIDISDSIFNAEIEMKKNLEESFQQLAKYEKNYKILEQQYIINKEKLKVSRLVAASISIILALIFIALILLIRAKNRIREQNTVIRGQLQDIQLKNRHTNELNQEILAQTEKITVQNEYLKKYQDELEKLIDERTMELSVALLRAQESDNLKTSFLQNISHEIRTPLNAISGFSQLLLTDDTNKKEYVEIINQNIYDLIGMVENIMIFSKIHSNQINIKKSEFVIETLIYELEKELADTLMKYKSSPVKFIINNQINHDLRIFSDTKLIQKILIQLIENSFKFTEKGYVKVDFFIEGDFFGFSVCDTGIGIKKEQIPHIFDVFRKIEGEHKLFRGTGIGLAIVKKYTEILGGEIFVESEYGSGTKLDVKLPF